MRLSPFKLGLMLVIAGMIWTGLVFDETEKKYETAMLKQSSSFETELELAGAKEIGYFKMHMPGFSGQEIFVQIQDPNDNVIREEMVKTKMSVGYFDFEKDGRHAIKITNLAKETISVEIEFGSTNSQKMQVSGVMILAGALTMMVTSYLKIKNYKIEHPEENIS